MKKSPLPADPSPTELIYEVAGLLTTLVDRCGIDRQTLIAAIESAAPTPGALSKSLDPDLTPATLTFMGSMLSLWRSLPEYVDSMGNPLSLPRDGEAPSLSALYALAVSRLPNPQSSRIDLDELISRLLTSGALTEQDGLVSLTWHSVSYRLPGTSSNLAYLALLRDFLSTSTHNAIAGPDDETLFQRRAYSLAFPIRNEPQIKAFLEDRGMDLLEEVDAIIEDEPPKGIDDSDLVRLGVGIYMFRSKNFT